MYYTLINAIDGPKGLIDQIRLFFDSNQNLKTILDESLELDFPDDSREIMQRDLFSSIKKQEKKHEDTSEIINIIQNDFLRFLNEPLKMPFFLHNGKNNIIILNDELIGYTSFSTLGINPIMAYSFLKQFYQSPKMREIIPKELLNSFDYQTDYPGIKKINCLFGMDFRDTNTCFKTIMEINNEGNEVILRNFSYANTPLDYEVILPLKDAFFIFANLLHSSYKDQVSTLLRRYNKKIKDVEFLKQQIKMESIDSEKQTKVNLPLYNALLFSIDYINFALNKIVDRSLSPLYFLQSSGIKLLVSISNLPPIQSLILNILEKLNDIDDLAFHQKLLFYTLIEELPFTIKVGNQLRVFYENNKRLLEKLDDAFQKDFPLPSIKKIMSKKLEYKFIPTAKKISHENFWDKINELRTREFKILLVKSSRLNDASIDIQNSLSKKFDYPILNLRRLIGDLINEREISYPIPFDKGKIEIVPPPTKEEILALLKYQFKDEQFFVDKKTGKKMSIHVNKISPEKKDLVSVWGLFDSNPLLNQIDKSIFKIIIDCLLELSKEKALILPHPECEKEYITDQIMNNEEDLVILSKEFLEKAMVITFEPF